MKEPSVAMERTELTTPRAKHRWPGGKGHNPSEQDADLYDAGSMEQLRAKTTLCADHYGVPRVAKNDRVAIDGEMKIPERTTE